MGRAALEWLEHLRARSGDGLMSLNREVWKLLLTLFALALLLAKIYG